MLTGCVDAMVAHIRSVAEDVNADPRLRLDAAKYLLDQAIGRPPQRVQLAGEDGGALTIRVVYDAPALVAATVTTTTGAEEQSGD